MANTSINSDSRVYKSIFVNETSTFAFALSGVAKGIKSKNKQKAVSPNVTRDAPAHALNYILIIHVYKTV